MIRSLRHVLLGGLVLVAASSAQAAIIVSSTFDTTSEGWTGVYLPGSAFSSPAPFQAYFPLSPSVPQPVFDGTVGNPTVGSLRYDDSSNNTWTFMKAPASYSGDLTAYAVTGGTMNILGGSLKFDFRIDDSSTLPPELGPYYGALFYSDMGTPGDTSDDITLIKELTLPAVSGAFFTHTIDIPTSDIAPGNGWHKDYFNNNVDGITAAEFEAVFSDLDGTFINAHWRNANVITYFDNISFNGTFTPTPPAPIPEPSSLVLLLTAGIPALVAYRRRKAQRVA